MTLTDDPTAAGIVIACSSAGNSSTRSTGRRRNDQPHDGSLIGRVAQRARSTSTSGDGGSAAFPDGRPSGGGPRPILLRLADLIESNADELARLESLDTGHPIRDSRNLDVVRTAAAFRYFGGIADKLQGDVIPVEPGFLNMSSASPSVSLERSSREFPIDVLQLEDGPALAAATPSSSSRRSSLR